MRIIFQNIFRIKDYIYVYYSNERYLYYNFVCTLYGIYIYTIVMNVLCTISMYYSYACSVYQGCNVRKVNCSFVYSEITFLTLHPCCILLL